MITKPPGWPFLTAVSAVGLVLLYWASAPYRYTIEMFLFAVFVVIPLALVWLVRIILAGRKDADVVSDRLRRWFLPWIVLAVVLATIVVDAPFWVRFTISKPSMEAFAKTVTEETTIDASCRWLGLYRVCWASPYSTIEAEVLPGSAALSTEEWAIHSNTGFVWLPKGRPEETMEQVHPWRSRPTQR
ncbi:MULTISPECIES: hypothetical protein [unclassified Streptosporangium]|uniref:hypothetical protein n=1 Tax=unclassified Streptosporangium TaxID=2632669 RepID=UPI002E2A4C9F|nr:MULTISPECIES: hypothetical protein [unclassified Streptosporangium]